MKLSGRGNYLTERTVKGTKQMYYFAKFIDDSGNELEVQVSEPLNLVRFEPYDLVVDVIQGKYPRYNLIEFKPVDKSKLTR